MSQFKFSCPHCERHLQVNESMSGRQIQCPACHHLIIVPPSPVQAAQGDYKPESGRTWHTFINPVPPPKGLKLKPKDEPPNPPEKQD